MSQTQRPVAKLALADGTVFTGRAFGCTDVEQPVAGEVVFNTAMTGYQEILTDPSYAGQIVTMTYPLIGNYGVNEDDLESRCVQARGFVVRELARLHHNHRSQRSLGQWLADQGVLAVDQIDTRALTRKLRIDGSMNGVLSCGQYTDAELVDLARGVRSMAGLNLAEQVSPTDTCGWIENLGDWRPIQGYRPSGETRFKVVAIDCGAKSNILRNLADAGCEVTVVPHDWSAVDILALEPDGVFISNGPGDPEPVQHTIQTLKDLHGQKPIFGICLGHQLLALSLGASTYKMKFGHRGANQPVQNLATGKVEITSQNHGFAVDGDSLKAAGCEVTHINLNDRTIEGFRHADLPIFSVQYHPEASPGPHDSAYLFDCFMEMMQTGRTPSAEDMHAAQKQRNQVGAA